MLKYKVWYIPQIPMEAFEYETDSLTVAQSILEAISQFSLFEFYNNVKPDYADAGGLVVWDEDEQEWLDVDEEEAETWQTSN